MQQCDKELSLNLKWSLCVQGWKCALTQWKLEDKQEQSDGIWLDVTMN